MPCNVRPLDGGGPDAGHAPIEFMSKKAARLADANVPARHMGRNEHTGERGMKVRYWQETMEGTP